MSSPVSRILKAERWMLPADLVTGDRPLVTVGAPAGYGKSTLLAEWCQELKRQACDVVSLVMDPDDRDGDRLILDLLHAFAPADAQRSHMLLGGVGEQGKRAVIMALLAEIASRRQRTALFIDDTHWLAAAAVGSILRQLITHQPSSLALVLSGRNRLAAHSGDALLQGRARSYGAEQLAFRAREVADLLRQHGVEPRPSLVDGIMERSRGWPAVVRLIAMILQEEASAEDSLLQGLVERRQVLTEYLSDVLLSRLPARSARFLLGISLLRRFSAELAAATTDMGDADRLLEELERLALPWSPSGDPTLPYALHPLVREFLLARLRREEPEDLQRFTSAARVWLTDNRRIDAAIDLSLDVGDVTGAAELIDRFARSAARHYGRHATFLYWCNKIPPAQLSNFPRIQVVRVWSLNVVRRYDEADRILTELSNLAGEEARAASPSGPTASSVVALAEFERYVQRTLRDQWIGLASAVRHWLARWPDAETLYQGMAYTMIGCGETAASDFESALQSYRTARRLYLACDAHYVAVWVAMWTAVALAKQGKYRDALHECDEAVSYTTSRLGGHTPAELMIQAQRGFLLYEFNRLDEAGSALEHGLTALVEQSSVDSMIMGYVALARLQNARCMHLDALETLAEGEVLGWSHALPRLAIALAAERIDLLLRQGETAQAVVLWQELERTVRNRLAEEHMLALHDKAQRIEARIALLRGEPERVQALLTPALEQAHRTGQKRKQVEIRLLCALSAQEAQCQDVAIQHLHDALDVAMSQGFVRVFVDEGEAAGRLLTAYRETRVRGGRVAMGEYLQQLLNALEEGKPKSPAAFSTVLTQQEARILGKLQSPLSNRELADSLFITEGTLKWHLKNIYAKLGVTSRVAAIAVSRERGLLSGER